MSVTLLVALLLCVAASFGAGWFAHRRQTYWAMIRVRGMLEQWVEEQCGHLLGIKSCEELDGILENVMHKQHMPLLIRLRKRKKPRRVARAASEGGTE